MTSKFSVGERVVVCSKPAAGYLHGRYGTVVEIYKRESATGNELFIAVKLDNDNQIRRSWSEGALRKLSPLEQLI